MAQKTIGIGHVFNVKDFPRDKCMEINLAMPLNSISLTDKAENDFKQQGRVPVYFAGKDRMDSVNFQDFGSIAPCS